MSSSKANGNGRRWWIYGGALTALVLVLAVAGIFGAGRGPANEVTGATFVVKHGPMTISVTEGGTIQSRDQVVIKNQVQGSRTIIYLIAEGVHVKKGQLLVQLDSSDLEDRQVDQQITVENAQAALTNAKENLEITKSQAQSDIANAELNYRFAKDDLDKYLHGEYPQSLQQDDVNITLAKEKLDQAEETLKWSLRLHAKKYISETELESDQLARDQAALNYKLALGAKELLTKYTYKRQVAQLTSDVQQNKMALDRIKRKAQANIIQAQANLRAKQAEADRQQAKLDKLNDQISKCKIVAPRAGMVIYSTTGKGNWRGNQQPLDEGQMVRQRQELIDLPTPGSMTAEIKVHESNIDKIRVGQPVLLTVDAYPGQTFTGKVTKISPLPDAQSVWLNPDLKVYDTQIRILGDALQLRTGMSCQAKIIVDHYADATYVPVQSVIRVGNQPTVYLVSGGEARPQAVTLGLDNNRMVRIIKGLSAGEQVLLAPPLSAGGAAQSKQLIAASKGQGQAHGQAMAKQPPGKSKSGETAAETILKRAESTGYQPPTEKSVERKRHGHAGGHGVRQRQFRRQHGSGGSGHERQGRAKEKAGKTGASS